MARTDAVPFPESLFERFKLLRHVASGGGGSVYLAEDRFLEREVAIKLPRDVSNPRSRARFLREASTLCRIRHPNVLEVLDAGEVPEGPYLVTEFLEGSSLQSHDIAADPLPPILQLASGLEAVHAAGVLHRDIKPSNAVLSGDGRCVLVDFGLALGQDHVRVTREGKVVGTLGFFAPELIRGEDQTPATDWYSLGASLFALLERRVPYSVAEMAKIRSQPPPPVRFERTPPDGPAARVARALLTPDPVTRPSSRQQLDRIAAGEAPDPVQPGDADDAPSPQEGITEASPPPEVTRPRPPVHETGGFSSVATEHAAPARGTPLERLARAAAAPRQEGRGRVGGVALATAAALAAWWLLWLLG